MDSIGRANRLDCIDRQVTELLLHAEKVCRKLRMGEVDFSPEVSRAADEWYMWRVAIKVAVGKYSLLPELKRICRKTGVSLPNLTNVPFLRSYVDQHRAVCVKLKRAHVLHRKQFLLRTRRKSIWQQEQRKRQYTRCKAVFGKRQMRAIDRVEFREGSDLVQVSTQAAVEAAIMRENTGRFKLAYSSPFLRGDILEQLGMSGEGPLVQDILHHQGFLDLHPSVRDLLSLFNHSPHSPISSIITPDEWVHH